MCESSLLPKLHPFPLLCAESIHIPVVFRVREIPFGGFEIFSQFLVLEDVASVGEGKVLQDAALLGGDEGVVVVFVVGVGWNQRIRDVVPKGRQQIRIGIILFCQGLCKRTSVVRVADRVIDGVAFGEMQFAFWVEIGLSEGKAAFLDMENRGIPFRRVRPKVCRGFAFPEESPFVRTLKEIRLDAERFVVAHID